MKPVLKVIYINVLPLWAGDDMNLNPDGKQPVGERSAACGGP